MAARDVLALDSSLPYALQAVHPPGGGKDDVTGGAARKDVVVSAVSSIL